MINTDNNLLLRLLALANHEHDDHTVAIEAADKIKELLAEKQKEYAEGYETAITSKSD
jgi:putative ribosome biogenesis GTPase RsgA